MKFFDEQDIVGKNCFAYALGLDVYPNKNSQEAWIVPSSVDIAGWLNDLLVEDSSGDIIVYFDADKLPCHMGLVKGEYVESKWRESHVYRHDIFATPYGRAVKRYRVTDFERLKLAWKDEVDWMKNP